MSEPAFVPGDSVVYPSQGLAQVEGAEERGGARFLRLRVVESGMVIAVPFERAREFVRRPVSRDDAQRLVAILRDRSGQPDDRHAAYRYRDCQRILVKGSLDEQVRALQRQYLSRYKPSLGEARLIDTFESVLLGELAHVLGISRDTLADELHVRHYAFSALAPARPPEQPLERPTPPPPVKLRDHDYLGEFQIASGTLAIGESPSSESGSSLQRVRRGSWHAFLHGGDDPDALIAIHRDHISRVKTLARSAREVARVVIDGGAMTMLDGAVRDDASYLDEAMFPLFTTGLIRDRGCHYRTRGDGTFVIRGASDDRELVYISVGES